MPIDYKDMPKGIIPGAGDMNAGDVGGADTKFNGSRGTVGGRVQPLAVSSLKPFNNDPDGGYDEGLEGTAPGSAVTHYAVVKPSNAKEEGL